MPRKTKSQKISQHAFLNSRRYKIILTALVVAVLLGLNIFVNYTLSLPINR